MTEGPLNVQLISVVAIKMRMLANSHDASWNQFAVRIRWLCEMLFNADPEKFLFLDHPAPISRRPVLLRQIL
jgi:hypothetical protein